MLLRVRARVRVRVRVREKVSASSEWGGEVVNGEGTWSAGRGSGKGSGRGSYLYVWRAWSLSL
jgi:hypothetical protein